MPYGSDRLSEKRKHNNAEKKHGEKNLTEKKVINVLPEGQKIALVFFLRGKNTQFLKPARFISEALTMRHKNRFPSSSMSRDTALLLINPSKCYRCWNQRTLRRFYFSMAKQPRKSSLPKGRKEKRWACFFEPGTGRDWEKRFYRFVRGKVNYPMTVIVKQKSKLSHDRFCKTKK